MNPYKILLDLMIPKISGMGVMQHIREKSFVPFCLWWLSCLSGCRSGGWRRGM